MQHSISGFFKRFLTVSSIPLLRQIVLLMLFLLGWASTAQAGTVSQTISFWSGFQPTMIPGSYGYNSIATSSSGLPVSISSLTPSICTTSGNSWFTLTAIGTCTIAADQAGDSTYSAAPQVTLSIQVVMPLSQTITFTSSLPATMQVGTVYTVAATSSSGLPVNISATTSFYSLNGCSVTTVSPGVAHVTAVAAGTCDICASAVSNQVGTQALIYSFAQVSQSSLIQPVTSQATSQTIGAITFSPTTISAGGLTTASATASSGLAVTFSSMTPNVCTVSGSTVHSVVAGICTIAANQAGNASYSAAPQVTQSIQVVTASSLISSQTIGAIGFSPTTLTVSGTSTASATASSGLEVTFTSLTPSICTITTSKSSLFSTNTYTVTGVALGVCTIAANQAGGFSLLGGTYSAAHQVTQNIVVGASRTDCLLNWAEQHYPQYFAPAGAIDVTTVSPYTYRYYSGTHNYLAVSSADNNVWVLGPVSGNTLVDVGPVASFLAPSGCQ